MLHVVNDSDRFMRVIFYLHGELLLGTAGSMLVELAASWTILMLLSGSVFMVAATKTLRRRALPASASGLAHVLA